VASPVGVFVGGTGVAVAVGTGVGVGGAVGVKVGRRGVAVAVGTGVGVSSKVDVNVGGTDDKSWADGSTVDPPHAVSISSTAPSPTAPCSKTE
jgi:hypothetical protein